MVGLVLGVVAPHVFILVFVLAGMRRPGYRPRRHYVSLLALGPGGWKQRVNFVACGAAMLVFAHSLGERTYGALPIAVIVFAVALIASGVFVADPALGYPPGSGSAWTVSKRGMVHNIAGLAAFVSVIVAAVLGGLRFTGTFKLYSFAVAIIVALAFVLFARGSERAARDPEANVPVGKLQRIAIIAGWTWMSALALRYLLAPAVATFLA